MHGTSTTKHSIASINTLTKPALSQKYELMEYGYDQSLLIRPEANDGPAQCKPDSYSLLALRLQLMGSH